MLDWISRIRGWLQVCNVSWMIAMGMFADSWRSLSNLTQQSVKVHMDSTANIVQSKKKVYSLIFCYWGSLFRLKFSIFGTISVEGFESSKAERSFWQNMDTNITLLQTSTHMHLCHAWQLLSNNAGSVWLFLKAHGSVVFSSALLECSAIVLKFNDSWWPDFLAMCLSRKGFHQVGCIVLHCKKTRFEVHYYGICDSLVLWLDGWIGDSVISC